MGEFSRYNRRALRRGSLLALVAPALIAGACGSGTTSVSDPLCAASPGPAPLRRLTRFEYGRTLNTLTGVAPSVAAAASPRRGDAGLRRHRGGLQRLDPARRPLPGGRRAGGGGADRGRRAPDGGRAAATRPAATRPASTASSPRFGRRAWRRPLADDERQAMQRALHRDRRPRPARTACRRWSRRCCSRRSSCTGPSRLTRRHARTPLDGPALATRLAFLLTGAGPDDTLLTAAADGLLAEDDRSAGRDRSPAGRPAGPPSCSCISPTSGGSCGQLSGAGQGPQPVPDLDRRHPGRAGRGDAPVPHRRLAERPTLATLLTAPVTFVDADAGVVLRPAGARRRRILSASMLDPARAAGLLTQGSFLATHAKADQTSPVLRGKFVRAAAVLHAAPSAAARHRRPAADGRSAAEHAPALRAAHRRRRAARPATCSWTRSASRSSTTTPPGAGATSTAARPVDATGDADRDRRRRADRRRRRAWRPAWSSSEQVADLRRDAVVPLRVRARRTDRRRPVHDRRAGRRRSRRPSGDFRQMVRATVRMAAFRTCAAGGAAVKTPLSRRSILRGAGGAAIALPWLEAMAPQRRARAGRARASASS